MYDELVALLRKKYDKAPMVMEAADAIRDYYEKRGKLFYNSTGFICFTSRGGMTLNIKYSPYWCPMGKEKK